MEYQEKEIHKSYDAKLMWRLIKYAKAQWLILLLSILMMLFITGVDLVIPYVTKIAIDDYITPVSQTVYLSDPGDNRTDFVSSGKGVVFPGLIERTFDRTVYENKGQIYKTESGFLLIDGTSKNLSSSGADVVITPGTINIDGKNYSTTPLTESQIANFKTYNKSQITLLTLILGGILLLNFAFSFAHTYLLNYASQKIVYNMREQLFNHVENMSLSFFDKNPVGRLVTRVSNDMENINEMFTTVLVTSLKDFLLLFGTVVVMAAINFKLTVVCLSTIPLVLISAQVFRTKARAVQREVKIKIAKINATLAENINGMKIIQIFNREKSIFEDFDVINKDFLKSSVQETKVYAIFRPTMNLAYSISLSLLLWFGGGDAIMNLVELGVLVAFITYTQQFFRPIMDLSEKFNIFQSSMASAERIFMLLDEETLINNPENPKTFQGDDFKGSIVFEDVWFSYDEDPKSDEDYVLKGVSFEIGSGESLALVGATGSGKTTIISLLNRFYDIQKGHIYIDGIDIRELEMENLREQIGIVLQDVFLFAGDIKSNIRLHDKSISDERIKEIATYVNADTFISKLKNGYDEEVTERGSTLSAGQRQLLSFARALAFDPKILILDEATSNIDTETELLIQDAINKIITGRTTVIVAHRLSTIQHASKIIVMNKGEVKEVGNHQELLENGGMYYDLYKLQYKDH